MSGSPEQNYVLLECRDRENSVLEFVGQHDAFESFSREHPAACESR